MEKGQIIKELEGHSGCKLYLMKGKKDLFVRKISKNIEYNKRLQNQRHKQGDYVGEFALSPEIIKEGKIEGLYFFDMQYIRGNVLSSSLTHYSEKKFNQIADILVNIILEHKSAHCNIPDIEFLINRKLLNLYKFMPKFSQEKVIKRTFNIIESHKWKGLKGSYCHGDFTLENIIYSVQGDFYLIDFLDSFLNSWISDISKILQDLFVGWSFRHEFVQHNAISENVRVKVLLFKQLFISRLDKIIDREEIWDDVFHLLVLNLLRIIPYVTDNKIYNFIIKSLDAIIFQIEQKGHYEYINNTVCWPVYTLPRS